MTRRSKPCCCDICGVSSLEKPVIFSRKYNKLLCGKHKWELDKYGEIKNPTPYNRFDKNRYRIEDDVVYMDIYDKFQNKIAEAIFDKKYLNDITERKWRLCYKRKKQYPYVSTKATPEEGTAHTPMHRFVAKLSGLNINGFEIDHINGNTLDNRLCNLRLATRHEQVSNIAPKKMNKYGIRGISYDKRYNKYVIDFGIDGERYYFKPTKALEEAVYTRYIAEKYFFDDAAISRHLPEMQPYIDKLSESQKQEIENYVVDKLIKRWVNAS